MYYGRINSKVTIGGKPGNLCLRGRAVSERASLGAAGHVRREIEVMGILSNPQLNNEAKIVSEEGSLQG